MADTDGEGHRVAMLHYHRQGQGPPLLLIHGLGGSWHVWSPVIEQLSAHRDVIAIDLPGYGCSPRTAMGASAGPEALATAVAGFLDTLGLGTVHVAGNSMGGWTALELAKRGRARSVAALSPAGFYGDTDAAFVWASLWFSKRVARLLAASADRTLRVRFWRTVLFAQTVGRPGRLTAPDATGMLRTFAAATDFDADLLAIARNRFTNDPPVTVPVTIGWGEHDRLLFTRQARRAVRVLPHARLVTLRDAGHLPTYDASAAVVELLLAASH